MMNDTLRQSAGGWMRLGMMMAGVWLGAAGAPGHTAVAQSVQEQVLELTGGRRAKVVWAQAAHDANHTNSPLMLFDTKDGRVRELPFTGIQAQLTPDGTRVLAVTGPKTDRTLKMYETDSGRVTDIATGPHTFPLFIWNDPQTGRDWVYVNAIGAGGEFQRGWEAGQDVLYRIPLDQPAERELVWDRTTISEFFMLSADGTHACTSPTFFNIGRMAFAFDAQGRVDQEASEFKPLGRGCFPGIAPDNSYRIFVLTGNHRAITLFDEADPGGRQINVSHMPGVDGRQVWLTRWSTHPRYLTLMGPDSNEARIWLGRFNEEYTEVEAWVQINSDGAKSWKSHAWIEQDSAPRRPGTSPRRERVVEPAPEWPAAEGAVFALRENRVGTPVTAFDDRGREQMAFSLGLRGRSLLGRSFELVCDGGSFHARDAGTWIGRQVSEAGAFTIEATLQPAEAGEDTRGVVLVFANDEQTDIALLQYRNWLYLRVREEQPIPLFEVEAGQPVHVTVTGEQGRATVYRNGEPVRAGPLPADAADWGERELVMGAAWNETHPWRGRLQGISVYPRALSEQEVARQALAMSAVIADREPVERIRFRGTLVRQAETSAQEAIRPYTRSLTAAEYRVHSVLEGEWDEPTIMVLHWMVMDDKRLPIADREPGERVELVVELLDDQPQLESERRDELPDADLDTILFYSESDSVL